MPYRAVGTIITEYARDPLVWTFMGLGISLSPHEYFGGLFLSCAGASIVARRRGDPRKLWSVIATAAFGATIAAIYGAGAESATFPPQIAMMAAGIGSGTIVNIVIKVLDRTEDRSEEIADKVIDRVLPGDET